MSKKNPYAIVGSALSGAGHAASKAGGGGGGGGTLGYVGGVVSHFPSQVKQGSVSSGSVPSSAYGGAYSQYAPSSGSSAAAKAAAAAAQAQAQARRQRRAKQAARVHKEQDRKRKQRSGQDMKVAKSVSKGLRKVTKATRKPQPALKLLGSVKTPKLAPTNPSKINFNAPEFKAIDKGYARLTKPGTNRKATGLPAAESAGKPGVTQPTRKPRRSPQNASQRPTGGLTKPLATAKKPRKVAKRLEKAVKKSQGGVPDYVPQEYQNLVSKASRKSNVPAPILSALLRQESGFQPDVGSPAGAQGIAQFMPATAAGRGVDPMDPKSAIPGAADLLAENKKNYGSWKNALAAYNAGGGAVEQYGGVPPYAETQNYVKTIMSAAKTETGSKAKPIPTKLKRTARQTLGKAPTKAILKGGKVVKDPDAGEKDKPSKADQRWGGAVGAIHAVLPKQYWADARGDKRTPAENAAVGGSSTSDHLTTNTNSFGADLPPDDALAKQIADNLGLPTHTGLQTIDKDGVRYQLIWQAEGHYDHVHLGAEILDPSKAPFASDPNIPIKGTKLAVKKPLTTTTDPTSAATGGTTTLTGALSPSSATGAPSATGKSQKARKTARGRRRNQRYAAYTPYADAPEGYYSVDPDTYQADPFLKRLAELAK